LERIRNINTSKHNIKIGGELTFASSNFEAHFTEHGSFSFTTDTPFSSSDPRTWPQSFTMQSPGFYTYNLTNHTTLYGGNSTMVSSSYGIRTSAPDARQTQWGARFVF
jgi:hypothetical protein